MGEESEYSRALLQELDSHSRIPDLSSSTIEEFLEHGSVAARWWPRLVAWESRLLWILSGSSIIVSVTTFMLSFVTQVFSGHLGALELAGASIANVGIQGLAYGIMVQKAVERLKKSANEDFSDMVETILGHFNRLPTILFCFTDDLGFLIYKLIL